MKILILTLTGQRDKHIDKLLAEELSSYGHEVLVHSYINAGRQSVPYTKPDVVVHPFPGGDFKMNFIKQCKEWGCEVIVRRGEAGASREIFNRMSVDRQTLMLGYWDYSPYVDLELTWGQEFTDLLVEKGRIKDPNRLKACGGFAFDPYFRQGCERIPHERRTILFATGFSTADCRVERCECGLPEDSAFHKATYEKHRTGRKLWIDSIKELARWHRNEWDFTLKVRPGEMVGDYVRQLSDIVKIYPQTYPSFEALRVADVLVHTGSTMAIEAHLMGIPSINYYNLNEDELLASITPEVSDVNELEFFLTNSQAVQHRQSNVNENVYEKLQQSLYGRIDGKACERAAKCIHEHIKNKTIKTNIPDQWPAIPMYHPDKANVHLKKKKGDVRWVCPACRESYYTPETICIAQCPYCGMMIEREASNVTTTVVK